MTAVLRRPMHSQSSQELAEIDQYINYDQAVLSPTSKPLASQSPKSTLIPTATHEWSDSLIVPSQSNSQQTFAAPSHQYAAYPQNNGLPTGALLDSMPGYRGNQTSMSYNHRFYGNVMSDNLDTTPADDFDFGFGSNYTGSYTDMDIDFSTPPQGSSQQSTDADFIDPSSIIAQGPATPAPQAQAPRRAYPGMHQQQAAAKAQAEAQQQKQKEALARQQHIAATSNARTGRSPADPVVEDRISRLLSDMRHNSVGSSTKDDDTATYDQASSNHARSRKDEEDMDEDERLLASEEGKKLSSKERRQLRNKVSARAFRSRRKEYIGQLEGEIAAKTSEADDLRSENQQLKKENAQLLNLTRTLLESPAFSDWCNQVGGMPNLTTPSTNEQAPVLKSEHDEPAASKDVNPNQAMHQQVNQQQQDTPYIGMTMIPEHPVDFSVYNTNANNWGGNIDLGLYDTQVFAVTSIPEGPSIEQLQLPNLSEKPAKNMFSHISNSDSKNDVPSFERMPTSKVAKVSRERTTPNDEEDFDEADPLFTLYSDSPSPSEVSPILDEPLFGRIASEKAFGRVELVLEDGESCAGDTISSAAVESFERLCSSLEEVSERIFAVIPHR